MDQEPDQTSQTPQEPTDRFVFMGHPPTKQNLSSEQDETSVYGVGRWLKGEAKTVAPDVAEWLRATRVFRELAPGEADPEAPVEPQPETPADPKPEAEQKPSTGSAAATDTPAPKAGTSRKAADSNATATTTTTVAPVANDTTTTQGE